MEYLRERMRWFSRPIISDMPEEREIEKQLRAAAEQRRKDAGGKFELHPAARRLLQGEVVRIRGWKSAPPRPVFWPRFAWGTSMLAVLAIGVWVLVSSQKESESISTVFGKRGDALASKDSQPALAETHADSRPAQAEAPSEPKEMAITIPPTMEAARTATVATFDKAESKAISAQDLAVAPPVPKEVAIAIPPEVTVDQRKAETALVIAGNEGIATQEPSAHYNFSNAVTQKQGIANRIGLGFANAPPTKKRPQSSANEASILKTFQLELAGSQIRILDHDGSVYDGTLLAENREMGVMEERQSKEVGAEALTKSSDAFQSAPIDHEENRRFQQNFSFVAAGTNFSLGQRVTIKGEFSADASAAGKLSFNGQNIFAPPLKAKLQNKAGLTNGRIIGRAVTADGQVIEMNASQMQAK